MALSIVTTLPADSDTSSAVQLTGTALRISARVTSGGPATLALIRMNSSGKWYRATDDSGNQVEIQLTGVGNPGPAGTGLSGNTDWSFTLPAVGSNEWYGLLLDGGTTFSGTAELISISAPAAAGGTVPSGRALTMGSGLLIAGTSSADLSADRTIALDSTMWAIAASALTLAANYSYALAAGTGGIDAHLGTGDWKMPTGAGSWVGAANKSLSLVASGTGTLTLDNASTWSLGATAGTTGTIGRSGQSLVLPGVVSSTGVLSPPTVADAAVQGGVPLVFRLTLTSGADGNQDITVTPKIRVIDTVIVLKGAGTAGSLVTVKNGATAISNAVDVSAGLDKALFRISSIDDAQQEISAGGTLRLSKASTGGDFPGAEVYVYALHVA